MGKVLIGLVLFMLVGCTPVDDVIYVPSGQAVMVRQTIKDVPVWVLNKDGEKVRGKIDIPAGWYCLPDEGEYNE